ncbi:MAG: DUF3806 domain-containing protein [bacterium]|nr:DUF3806 domain-containing protein [bacterium]
MTEFEQHDLDERELADLEAKRSWVRAHYDEGARSKYETLEGKLVLLDTILQNGWVAPSETVKLQSLGVTFGDALAQQLAMRWVAIEDEYGRDPALVVDGTSIRLFPLTTISKRIEQGEAVDVHGLFRSACAMIEQVRSAAD